MYLEFAFLDFIYQQRSIGANEHWHPISSITDYFWTPIQNDQRLNPRLASGCSGRVARFHALSWTPSTMTSLTGMDVNEMDEEDLERERKKFAEGV